MIRPKCLTLFSHSEKVWSKVCEVSFWPYHCEKCCCLRCLIMAVWQAAALYTCGVENEWTGGGQRAERHRCSERKKERKIVWSKEDGSQINRRRESEQWSADEERRRDTAALRSSKRCPVAMAAPYLWSPWERLNPVAARLCPEARERERKRKWEGGGELEREKNSNRTASLAWGIGADLENVGRVLISLSLSFTVSLLYSLTLSLSLTLSIDFRVFFFFLSDS